MEITQKALLWQDTKFRWMIASVVLVGVFEFLSLASIDVFGYLVGDRYSRPVAALFFAAIILAIGWRTLWSGFQVLSRLNF